jgi:hypothetical protein
LNTIVRPGTFNMEEEEEKEEEKGMRGGEGG